jgi:hypothetical protein
MRGEGGGRRGEGRGGRRGGGEGDGEVGKGGRKICMYMKPWQNGVWGGG